MAEPTAQEFVGLLVADDDLVRREFEAIVAAEWPIGPPASGEAAVTTAMADHPAWAPRLHRLGVHAADRPRRPGAGGWARQRSPP